MNLRNQWGTFTADEVEVARLRSVALPDEMRRAVTLAKVILGGRILDVRAAGTAATPAAKEVE